MASWGRRGLFAAVLASGCADKGGAGGTGETGTGDTGPGTSSTGTTGTGVDTGGSAGSSESDGSGSSTGDPGDPPELGPWCESGLPFAYARPEEGDPVDAATLATMTERYLSILEDLRYFDFVAERVHGWPESDPRGRYWHGTWWSGVTVVKEGGAITYRHEIDGADNNGLRTGPILQGACFAHALWGRPEDERLVREMVRGFVAWMMAMEREPDDPDAPLLSRAFYPESVMATDDGVDYFIDYSMNHPGNDNGATEYVHVPNNPHWGDIWIKNKRSKDDIGHMLRAIAQLGACAPLFADAGTTEDFVDIRTIYSSWSRRVEDDGWAIASLDKDAQLWIPDDLLANFIDAECDAKLALRLLGRGDQGALDCGNGVGRFDDIIIASNDQNGHILRSFHEAAAALALMTGNDELAQALLEGMAFRLVQALDGLEGLAEPVPFVNEAHLATMMAHAASTGVPLTWREVRFLHARIDQALASYGDAALDPVIATFDPATPDGEYWFEPWGTGFEFVGLAGLLGTCASPCLNPESKPVLDCDMVAAWSP